MLSTFLGPGMAAKSHVSPVHWVYLGGKLASSYSSHSSGNSVRCSSDWSTSSLDKSRPRVALALADTEPGFGIAVPWVLFRQALVRVEASDSLLSAPKLRRDRGRLILMVCRCGRPEVVSVLELRGVLWTFEPLIISMWRLTAAAGARGESDLFWISSKVLYNHVNTLCNIIWRAVPIGYHIIQYVVADSEMSEQL